MNSVRVFISHAHDDDAFAARLAADLRSADIDVWIDDKEIAYDDFVMKISEGLEGRQWLILVMTPASLRSQWVRREVNAALNLVEKGRMRGVIPIAAMPFNEREVPALWDSLHRYDATKNYDAALAGLLRAFGANESTSKPATSNAPSTPSVAPAAPRSGGLPQNMNAPLAPGGFSPPVTPYGAQGSVYRPPVGVPPVRPQPPRPTGTNWLRVTLIVGGVFLVVTIVICACVYIPYLTSIGLPRQTIQTNYDQTATAETAATSTAFAVGQTQPYEAKIPGDGCDKGGATWQNGNYVTATCGAGALHLVATNKSYIGSIYFSWLPSYVFPANYSERLTVSGLQSYSCAYIFSRFSRSAGTGYGFMGCSNGFQSILRYPQGGSGPTHLQDFHGIATASFTMSASTIGNNLCLQVGTQPKSCVQDATYTSTEAIQIAVGDAIGSAADFSDFVFTPLP
jgi:hypothetical protein